MSFEQNEQILTNKLFTLIKKHQWNEFINLIKNTKNIDVNIKDHSGNTLLQYAILPNRIDIVQILLEYGATSDNLDVDGKSILYIPIKYNYLEIADLLLLYNDRQIGISILNILDADKNSPIFYALDFSNLEALQLLIKYHVNINQVNSKGDTVLLASLKTKDSRIIGLILLQNPNVNQVNIYTGDSALHLTCSLDNYSMAEKLIQQYHLDVNIKNIETESTGLMCAIVLHQNNLINLLIKQDIKWDTQDIYGNTILHYCVREEMYLAMEKVMKKISLMI
jgi:ankyrin repeat protein